MLLRLIKIRTVGQFLIIKNGENVEDPPWHGICLPRCGHEGQMQMKTVKMNSIQMADFMPEPCVVVIETEDRIGGVEAVLRRAEELMAEGRFAEVMVASSRRRVSDGLKWNKTGASLELCASASDNNLHVWCVCWCELQKRIEEVQVIFIERK